MDKQRAKTIALFIPAADIFSNSEQDISATIQTVSLSLRRGRGVPARHLGAKD
jgi:hypothetical protein